ncbi:MAG: hypothetical protein IPH87_21710 [Anaerolineae bacterium]|nr:hypothetical protein [Anaerolineae bacterium]
MAEAVRLGLTVRPPHVNFSAEAFSLAEGRSGPVLFMGLGQVRDLRQAAITAICQERGAGKFSDLRDLLRRVALRPKEIEHLIRGGALDGLARSRASLLAEAQEFRHGSAGQMIFDFGRRAVPAETLRQRWDWETELLGPAGQRVDRSAGAGARKPAGACAPGRTVRFPRPVAPDRGRASARLDRRPRLFPGRRRHVRHRPRRQGGQVPGALATAAGAGALGWGWVGHVLAAGGGGGRSAKCKVQSAKRRERRFVSENRKSKIGKE